MPDRKTNLSAYEVLTLVSAQFPNPITNLDPLKEGQRSQVFSFESGGRAYVIRLSTEVDGFLKDKYAFEHFSSVKIPIPNVLNIGQIEGGHFAISEKLPGKDLGNINIKNNLGLLKDMFEVVNAIHQIEVPEDAKFGFWDKNGEAGYESIEEFEFREELAFVALDGGNYTWEDVNKLPMVDKELLEELKSKARGLLTFIPSQKWLVHGDYGFDNLLAEEAKVTGVLDWSESFYGDFLYDTAWLDFWSDDVDFIELYRRYYKEAGIDVPHYDERIMFHKLQIGRNSLALAALREDKEDYQEVSEKVRRILESY